MKKIINRTLLLASCISVFGTTPLSAKDWTTLPIITGGFVVAGLLTYKLAKIKEERARKTIEDLKKLEPTIESSREQTQEQLDTDVEQVPAALTACEELEKHLSASEEQVPTIFEQVATLKELVRAHQKNEAVEFSPKNYTSLEQAIQQESVETDGMSASDEAQQQEPLDFFLLNDFLN
ncbi:MAG: hypothetical protein Q8Q25_00545 [bacterium]|nr:hypothetical protein [bacterium]